VLLWNTADDSIGGSALVGQGLITGIVFSPDSRAVVLTGYNGVLQLRILEDGSNSLLPGSPIASQPFAFLPNGRFVALDEQGRVAVIDIANRQSGLLSGAPGTPLSVAASPTGALVAVGDSGGAVTVWNQTGPQGQTLPANDLGAVTLLAFSSDGRYLAAVGPAANPRIALYDVTTAQLLRTLQGSDAAITAVAFQPGSEVLATTSFDGVVRFWNAGDGIIARTIAAPDAEGWFAGIAFSPDGSMLAASSAAGTVMVYDAGTGALLAEHVLEFSLTAISFSPDGSLLAVGSHDNSVRILTQPR
jgi:WD40 repeat protein